MYSGNDGFLGGYRVVRRLGAGSRSEVWLGRAPGDGEGSRTVALKAFRQEASTESIDLELAVLESIVHPHVVQLRDVASGPHGLPTLVLERLGHESLSALLTHRPTIQAGEVVTILAPLVAALSALHSSAVAHGSISATRVLFRPTGAPVLCGFGHVERLSSTTAVSLASSAPVARDRSALARLASGLLGRVEGDDARQLATWLQRRILDGSPENAPEELVSRLFDLADAIPVRLDRDSSDEPEGVIPLRVHRAEPIAPEPEAAPEPMSLQGAIRRVRVLVNDRHIPAVLRKKPVLVAMGLAIVLTVVVFAVPTGNAESAPPTAIDPAPTPAVTASAVSADDPVAALAALSQRRAACIRDLSILCLDEVVQPGSAALDDDVALIRGIEAGEVSGAIAEIDTSSIVITERMGGAALLAFTRGPNSEPASTLLVKGEAGWRIRDYLEG